MRQYSKKVGLLSTQIIDDTSNELIINEAIQKSKVILITPPKTTITLINVDSRR
jgi:hypothetical protein